MLEISRWVRFVVGLVFLCTTSIAFAGAYEDAIFAIRQDRADTVMELIGRGLDVNTTDPAGTTLLMTAAGNGNLGIVDFLLRSGANPLKQNSYGDSALAVASLRGHADVASRLLEAGARVETSGWGALHYAAFSGHEGVVHLLLAGGAKVNARAPNQQTALMLAARNGHIAVAKMLLDAGANPDLGDLQGNTAEKIALEAGNTDIAGLIKQTVRR